MAKQTEHERREAFQEAVAAERQRQIQLGYTAQHDDEHGIEHLMLWVGHYIYHDDKVKAAAMLEASFDWMVRRGIK